MKKLKCGVIGVGYLGRFHAQKYQHLEQVHLVGIYDINLLRAQAIAHELQIPCFEHLSDLLQAVEAVSIASSTQSHYALAKQCLEQGIHVLLEKPMTETPEQALNLIECAKKSATKLQIGHLERFNAARIALEPYLSNPLFIESHRLAPYNPRGADVNVILDLMIHDIDLIQTMVQSPITHVDASGAPVLSPTLDIANARITFTNQCIANVTASRVSFKTERKMRIFQQKNYLSIDYHNHQFAVFQKGEGEMYPGIPNITQEQFTFDKSDALLEEIKAFITAIQCDTPPLVPGQAGYEALLTATKISHCIQQNLDQHHATT